MSLTKTEIARRQLGTALALYLDDLDPVSVHSLACGGGEVAENLTVKAHKEPFSTHILKTRPDLDVSRLQRLRNEYWNALKHATSRDGLDRQDEETLEAFSDEKNDHVLFIGWYDYMVATGTLPLEAQVHQVWYFALYSEKLVPQHSPEPYTQLFGDLKAVSRGEAKRRLRVMIESYRSNNEILGDPATDSRPLIF